MLPLLLGILALAAFLGGLRAFERARVISWTGLLRWTGTLGALALVLMLVLTGRELPALGVAILVGPALWGWWQPAPAGPRPGSNGAMNRAEACAVLGVPPDARPAEIRAAHRRAIRAAHPDAGGSTAQAARVNQARDVLLRGR
ncbi:MAG: hypothetical protein ACP5NP_11925 [Acetobacteraceae bacterium]